MMRSLWNYRQFISSSIGNEFRARFSRSALGGAWMILNPLAQVAIYAFILSNVISAKLPDTDSKYAYAAYLMAGLLAWALFSEIITRCLTLFIEFGNLMKKMRFPRGTLPLIVVGSNLLTNMFLFAAMIAIFLSLGHEFTLQILWLAPLMMLLTCFSLAIGLIFGILNVFVRDVGHIIPIALQIWFWLTPIVYPLSIIPAEYHRWLRCNPMYHFSNAYQDVLLYGRAPQLEGILIISGITIVLMLMSFVLFRKANAEMVDVL